MCRSFEASQNIGLSFQRANMSSLTGGASLPAAAAALPAQQRCSYQGAPSGSQARRSSSEGQLPSVSPTAPGSTERRRLASSKSLCANIIAIPWRNSGSPVHARAAGGDGEDVETLDVHSLRTASAPVGAPMHQRLQVQTRTVCRKLSVVQISVRMHDCSSFVASCNCQCSVRL